ncbi:hypothetical protein SAY86_013092 [Trapa natans]|uniref:PPM-type phosphatase domain-containing protein n=1 Tax=Trapa natans TaxID=22666 RepID=A0AAN7MDX6_TRANT|nr:hypothetical protein SAY86_013092 [Trapa natans]
MGSGLSCFKPADRKTHQPEPSSDQQPDLNFAASSEPLDETLGHSFCYVRSSARFLSPTSSDRFVSPSQSLRFDDPLPRARTGHETGFRAISGASVSANTATPRTVLQLEGPCDSAAETSLKVGSVANGFESTSSFCALPLQTAPRGAGGEPASGSFFLSGPIERGALSGPLDQSSSMDIAGQVPFSAPLGGPYVNNRKKRKKKKSIYGIKKTIYGNLSDKKRPWVVPVLNFGAKKEAREDEDGNAAAVAMPSDVDNVQWALGKAGEDRVHVVVSEEQGWLFVGIYDGFNGPDAPEFLMDNLYRTVYKELQGLFWEVQGEGREDPTETDPNILAENTVQEMNLSTQRSIGEVQLDINRDSSDQGSMKRVTFLPEGVEVRRRQLWEYLAEEDHEDGLDLSGSQRFAFSVDDAISVNDAGSAVSAMSRRWILLSKLKHGLSKHKEGQGRKLFPWRFGLKEKVEAENISEEGEGEGERINKSNRRRKEGPVDHELVLRAISRALEQTENAFLDMTDKFLDVNPELALMGSCLLVVLMRDEDVYVMNVGDSRAVVAQLVEEGEGGSNLELGLQNNQESSGEGIIEEPIDRERVKKALHDAPIPSMRLTALQLSFDHCTSIQEEVIRIRDEHPDDRNCIANGRVKGRLKVTRAFGAGFLKQPKWNDALLEMFRNDYIGTAPYISCSPSLCHHELCPRDQFLVLSSDGLYQYFSNQEVVSHIASFLEKFPDGDPAQYLIEELLSRAAKKAGMELHELLDIPQGDRRKYHDDVTVMVISLEGRIWKSSGKYF